MKQRVFVLMLVTSLLMLALPAWAQDGDPVADGLAFLETMQNEDGGFTNGFAPESDTGATADAVVAYAAAGQDPNAVFSGEMMNPLTYLGVQVQEGNLAGAGQTAKVLSAVVAAGKDPADFAGHDLAADLLAMQADSSVFGGGAFDHCLSLVALQNAGADIPANAWDALLDSQQEDGGWGFMPDTPSDSNTTALCIQALALSEHTDAIAGALDYLAAIQNEDAGWPYQNPSEYGTDSDANSTALVTQALIAAGEDLAEWDNPQDWLPTLQLESGAFTFNLVMPADSVLATVAVIPALEGLPLNTWAAE
jgi:hypothetical protein